MTAFYKEYKKGYIYLYLVTSQKNIIINLNSCGMYSSKQIADYFLSKHSADGNITPMKLIKLVYIAHGWHLGITDTALIDENPEAWKYGPVIPSLYHQYKNYGDSVININLPNYSLGDKNIENFLDRVWEVYGSYNGVQLSAKTHQNDSPWSRVWNTIKNNDYFSLQIPEIFIKEHYKNLINRNRTSQTA